jgi:cytochrome P450
MLDMTNPHRRWPALRRSPPTYSTQLRSWLVTRAADIRTVAEDPGRYSSAVGPARDPASEFLLTVDGPRHSDDRAVFLAAFMTVLPRIRAAIPNDARRLRDTLPIGQPIDLLHAYLRPLCATVAQNLFQCDVDVVPALDRWATDLLHPQRNARYLEESGTWVQQAIASDATSALLHAIAADLTRRGRRADEITAQCHFLTTAVLVATIDTLSCAAALAVWRLLSGSAQTAGPEAAPMDRRRVSCLLRSDTPLQGLYRMATAQSRLGAASVARGDQLYLAWGSANQEMELAGSPTDFTFGIGPHQCPARGLVLEVIRVTLSVLHEGDRLLQLPPGWLPRFATHTHFRRMTSLVTCYTGVPL